MASIKISNTAIEKNLANIEGLVGYRTNPTTQDLETIRITGNYIGDSFPPDPNAPKQGFISTKPFTVFEDEANIQDFPGNSNRSILSYSGIETYGNLEVFTQTGIASFIGQSDTVLKSNEGSVTIQGGATQTNQGLGEVSIRSNGVTSVNVQAGGIFNVDSGGKILLHSGTGESEFYSANVAASSQANLKIYTRENSNNKGHIEILSAGKHADNKGIILKSATDIQVDLHSMGNGNTPIIGQALIAKDTDGNIEFGDGVILSQTAAGAANSALRYSGFGNKGLQVNTVLNRGVKVTTSQNSGLALDFTGVTGTDINAPMLGVIQAADAAAARTVLNVDQAGTDNSTPVTLKSTAAGSYLSLSQQEITMGKIDLSLQDNSTSEFAKASDVKIATASTELPNIKIEIGPEDTSDPNDPKVTATSSITIKTNDNSGLYINGADYGFNKEYPIAINLENLDGNNPVDGAGVQNVGLLMDSNNQVNGHKLEFNDSLTTGTVDLVAVPQSPDIVCELDGNANLENMDSGKAYVVPFTDSATSTNNQAHYVFTANNESSPEDWKGYIKIIKDGRYQINAKVGMYNAEKGNNPQNPTLTIWVEVSETEFLSLGNTTAPTGRTVHCLGSCQVNRDVNGLALIQGSTMLNLSANDYVRLIVRPDGFAGQSGVVDERAYFVYNDVEIPAGSGNLLSGHKPQIEIYKIN